MGYCINTGQNQQTSKNISKSEVEDVIVKRKNRPRKKLNYKTPANLMAEHMAAIAA